MVDVLSFVDVARSALDGQEVGGFSRQLAINGALLADPDDHGTLLDPGVSVAERRDFLAQLLGEIPAELPNDRRPLGYCPRCLGNDGWVFAATIDFALDTVRWSLIGYDRENGHPVEKTGPWWRRTEVPPPPDWNWWIVEPEDPELIYTFDRSAYERVIRAEIERLGTP